MEQPLAAAAGVGLDITGTTPCTIVDVGVHATDVTVLADGRVIDTLSAPVGCHDVERAVLAHVYRRHRLMASPHAAWRAIRRGTLTAFGPDSDERTEVQVSKAELAAALCLPVSAIVEAVRSTGRRGAERLATDVLAGGIVVVGGGALLAPLTTTLRDELEVRVTVPADPRRAVIRGLSAFVTETFGHPNLWVER
jgi:rod shape-determining protein MreB